ncbi:MAG: hypothetical protein ACE5KH_02995, partial [Candidatus Geothermarchaeales archaeon]
VVKVEKGFLDIMLRFVGGEERQVSRFSIWDRPEKYPDAYKDTLRVPSKTSSIKDKRNGLSPHLSLSSRTEYPHGEGG